MGAVQHFIGYMVEGGREGGVARDLRGEARNMVATLPWRKRGDEDCDGF